MCVCVCVCVRACVHVHLCVHMCTMSYIHTYTCMCFPVMVRMSELVGAYYCILIFFLHFWDIVLDELLLVL